MRENTDIVIIGGGASGLMAAITAAENGARVTVLEHMPRVGKKILSTGNGKCNLTNLKVLPDCYRSSEAGFPVIALGAFMPEDTIRFFRRLGVWTTDKNGYIYPVSGQAQTVLDALREKVESLGITTFLECETEEIARTETGFSVKTNKGVFRAPCLILAAGSMAAPSTGSDGSGYALAKSLGHKVKKPLPALVQLRCKGDFFKAVAGVRTEADVALYTIGKHGEKDKFLASDRGELQLTDYGISGIPVFQVSRFAAEALDQKKRVLAAIDFLPQHGAEEFFSMLKEQKASLSDRDVSVFLNGFFHKKLAALVLKAAGIRGEKKVKDLTERELCSIVETVKLGSVEVLAANPFEKAQVCMGGVKTKEVNPSTMESKIVPGLYFAGEILDVDGICGGYNLQWAWTSGFLAGRSAAKRAAEGNGN